MSDAPIDRQQLDDATMDEVSGGGNTESFNQALADLKQTNAEVTAANAEMQNEQARATVIQ